MFLHTILFSITILSNDRRYGGILHQITPTLPSLSLFIEPRTEVFCSKVPQSLIEGEVEVEAIQHFQIQALLTSSLSSLNIGPLLFNPYILHNFNKLPLVQPGDCLTFTFPTVT